MTIEELQTILNDRLREEKPFVVYHKPNADAIVSWLSDSPELLGTEDLKEPGFVFSPFEPGGKTILFSCKDSNMIRLPFNESDWNPSERTTYQEKTRREEGLRERHLKLVLDAVEEIRSGKAQKIVVSRKEEVSAVDVEPFHLFLRLSAQYPDAFSYLWFEPRAGLWAGASPETLVEVEGKHFSTMSLAGTRRDDGDQPTGWGEKEMEEQQIVTDLIAEELGSLVDHIGPIRTHRAGYLLHLRTDIRGTLPGTGGLPELIRRLHPTAAICGLPRKAALEFINQHEGYAREYYTGFLGELNSPDPERSHLFVNLRCMRLFPRQKKAWIYVGGGITSSSDPEKEWEETRAKSETVKRVFS